MKKTSSPRKGHNEFIARRAPRSDEDMQDALREPRPPMDSAPIGARNHPPRRRLVEDAEGFQMVVNRRSPRHNQMDGSRDSKPEAPAKLKRALAKTPNVSATKPQAASLVNLETKREASKPASAQKALCAGVTADEQEPSSDIVSGDVEIPSSIDSIDSSSSQGDPASPPPSLRPKNVSGRARGRGSVRRNKLKSTRKAFLLQAPPLRNLPPPRYSLLGVLPKSLRPRLRTLFPFQANCLMCARPQSMETACSIPSERLFALAKCIPTGRSLAPSPGTLSHSDTRCVTLPPRIELLLSPLATSPPSKMLSKTTTFLVVSLSEIQSGKPPSRKAAQLQNHTAGVVALKALRSMCWPCALPLPTEMK